MILNIKSVYTGNAFPVGEDFYVGTGSETTPAVYLHNLATDESSLVSDCPGGVMDNSDILFNYSLNH